MTEAIVLTQNEGYAGTVYDWKDVTGEHYQFPNQYRRRIVPGARFVYYRGERRADGRRAVPEYFGTGVVGDVYLDLSTTHLPAQHRRWNADIAEYIPFARAVPFRDERGMFMETGTTVVAKNHWGVGVRTIREARLRAIFDAAATPEVNVVADMVGLPALLPGAQTGPLLPASGPLLVPRITPRETGDLRSTFDRRCLSRRAREIGCAAEQAFYAHLLAHEPDPVRRDQIVWVANQGETPGYDIEDRRASPPIAYEVKGTTASAFPSFDITANELSASEALGDRFFIVLVIGCMSATPRFQLLRNPAKMLQDGTLAKAPIAYRIASGPGLCQLS
jgi:hypothetical protein